MKLLQIRKVTKDNWFTMIFIVHFCFEILFCFSKILLGPSVNQKFHRVGEIIFFFQYKLLKIILVHLYKT